MTYAPRGRPLEELTAGEAFATAARTVTEGNVDFFAGLSGAFNPLHTDEESARQSLMKGRIAHGMLVLALATGQANQPKSSRGRRSRFPGWTRSGGQRQCVLATRSTRS